MNRWTMLIACGVLSLLLPATTDAKPAEADDTPVLMGPEHGGGKPRSAARSPPVP